MSHLRIAIRSQGGVTIGLGHIRRCLNLAGALRRAGATVSFILGGDPKCLELVGAQGFDAVRVDAERDVEESAAAIARWGATVLVTDFYDIEPSFWIRLRSYVRLLVAIDDLAHRAMPVDLIVNGAANARELSYSALPSTRLLLGPDYVILREEFAQEPARESRGRVGRVLITVGGSDQHGLTTLLMNQSARLDGASLDVICGPFFQNTREIERAAAQSTGRVTLHHNPPGMRALMLGVDLAITGGGQTVYELAATATPAVAICVAENQRGGLAALEREGTLVGAGDARSHGLAAEVGRLLMELDLDAPRRRQMGARGRRVVDGRGAQRVAQVIVEEHGRRGAGELC